LDDMVPIVLVFYYILGGLLGSPALQVSEGSLPDVDTFVRKSLENLRGDRLLQSRYTFNMRQSKFEQDENGNLQEVEVNEYEVYPSLDDEWTYRRHISQNGRRLDPEKIEKQDREHDKKLEELAKKLEKEGIDWETYRLRMEKTELQEEESIIRELPQIYDITIIGREIVDGTDALQIKFQPRPAYKHSSRETEILSKIAGRAWFCEKDYHLMRMEVAFVDNLSFGWGLLARLHKGSSIRLRRQYVNDEIWLPAELQIEGSARMLLLKKITINTTIKFSDYKKYSVKTSYSFPRNNQPAGAP